MRCCLWKGSVCFLLGLCLGTGMLKGQGLPQWSAEDRDLLKSGELVVGAMLLVDDSNSGNESSDSPEGSEPMNLIEPVESAEPEADIEAQLIPDEYLDDYFDKTPESYLVDPQRLFSNQETLDREGFLKYYANESEVDIRIYLFEGKQEMPHSYSLARLIEEKYVDGPLTAVVFYFLGNPGRNELLFGGDGADLVGAEQLRKMLESAQIKALEKSDLSAQMESFIVQLSISTYWVEQTVLEARRAGELVDGHENPIDVLADPGQLAPAKASQIEELLAVIQPYLYQILGGLVSLITVVLVVIKLWVMWRRSRRYRFPVLNLPRRLGADYAAGVGAVMGFHNKLDSPSCQRDQLPDYLTRL